MIPPDHEFREGHSVLVSSEPLECVWVLLNASGMKARMVSEYTVDYTKG